MRQPHKFIFLQAYKLPLWQNLRWLLARIKQCQRSKQPLELFFEVHPAQAWFFDILKLVHQKLWHNLT